MEPPPWKKLRVDNVLEATSSDDEDDLLLSQPQFLFSIDKQVENCLRSESISVCRAKQFGTLAHSSGVKLSKTLATIRVPNSLPCAKPPQIEQMDAAAMQMLRQQHETERLVKQLQEKDGEVKIVREQKAAADKELAALKMALFQAKENEERIAVEVKNLVNKELNQLKTEQKFQEQEITNLKRELDRKGRELIKERSDRQKLADSVKRDECRINGVCYAYHDTGGHVKANQVLDKQFLSKNQAMPRGSRLSPLSFTKASVTDERSIAVTPNQNSTIIEPNLKLKVCLWSSARRKIREKTTKLNELCWVGHSPLLLETAWKFEEEDIFASPDPLANAFASLLTQVCPREDINETFIGVLHMLETTAITDLNFRTVSHFLKRSIAALIQLTCRLDEIGLESLAKLVITSSLMPAVQNPFICDEGVFTFMVCLLDTFVLCPSFFQSLNHGIKGFCLLNFLHTGMTMVVEQGSFIPISLTMSLIRIIQIILQVPHNQINDLLFSCKENCLVKIIPAISDLLQLLQPSYSFPLDRHPETARFSDGTVLLTNEYVDRANLLLKTFNSLLTVCGSNNDVYLRSVPLVLKKIYTKLCQHPQSCGKEGEVVDVLNIDHVAKLVDISVILMRHSWRRFYDSPEII